MDENDKKEEWIVVDKTNISNTNASNSIILICKRRWSESEELFNVGNQSNFNYPEIGDTILHWKKEDREVRADFQDGNLIYFYLDKNNHTLSGFKLTNAFL